MSNGYHWLDPRLRYEVRVDRGIPRIKRPKLTLKYTLKVRIKSYLNDIRKLLHP